MIRFLFFLPILLISCSGKKEDIEEYYPNGKIKAQYLLVDGKVDGTAVFYNSDGTFDEIITYKLGIPNGEGTSFYPNSNRIKERYFAVNNYKEGKMLLYDSLGNLKCEGKYIRGELNGMYYRYYPNGKVKSISLLFDGQPQSEGKFGVDSSYNSSWYYVEVTQKDTIDLAEKNSIIVRIGKPLRNVKILELLVVSDIPTDTSRIMADTISIIKPVNDTMLQYTIKPDKKGVIYWCGLLKTEHDTKEGRHQGLFRIREQFYVK